jgi:hypothetical protein
VAGVLIVAVGLPLTYGVDVATFVVSLVALALMRAVPPPPESEGLSLRAIADGLRYARSRQDLIGSYLIDMNAMFFGIPTALFPQVASHLGGAAVLGVLYAAPSAGSLLVTLTSGWARRVRRNGRMVALSAGVWGLGIIGFGFARTLPWAIAGLVVAGGADMVSGLCRTTMWNQSIPDALRGRLAGIEMLSYSSGPTLGNVEAGLVESFAGLRASIVSGGVLCVVGTVALAAVLPRFWNYDAAEGSRPACRHTCAWVSVQVVSVSLCPRSGSHSQEAHAPFEISSCQATLDDRRLGCPSRRLFSDHDHDHDCADHDVNLDDACTYDLDNEYLFDDHDDLQPARANSVCRQPTEGCRDGRNRSGRFDLQPRQRVEHLNNGLHA